MTNFAEPWLKAAYGKLRDAFVRSAIRIAPNRLAHFNNARLGFPRRVFVRSGGIGDDFLCTIVFRELKKRGEPRIVMRSNHRSLFEGNPDVDAVIRKKIPIVAPLLTHGLNFFDLSTPKVFTENYLALPCRLAGITGEVALRPYLFLRPAELAAGRLFDRQIAIQSSGMSANTRMKNKEWYPERFQEVAARLKDMAPLIQLGSRSDPPLEGVLDLRGRTSLREAAAILSHSVVFIGLDGFLMHLARAVECRSVIIYGGRLKASWLSYIANKSLVGITPCSPCWEENKCDYDRECMKMISVETVVAAAFEQIERHGTPLETEQVTL